MLAGLWGFCSTDFLTAMLLPLSAISVLMKCELMLVLGIIADWQNNEEEL